MWKVVTSSNLNPLLKLFFYSLILTNNNLLLKIYCENIVIRFLKIFYSLYYFSFLNFHFIHMFFFLFFFFSTHCPYLYPPSFICFVSLIQERSRLLALAGVALILQHSLSVSFFLIDSRGHLCKNAISPLFSPQFSSRFGRMRFVGLREKIFSWVFHP